MGFSQAPGLPYSKLGIPEDGDTASRAISKGKYVIWKGKNYFAKTDILQGETFVEDTNLTEIPDGALNGIADALNTSLRFVKLWENSSPTSSQSEQTLTLSESINNFDFLMVDHCVYNERSRHKTDVIPTIIGNTYNIESLSHCVSYRRLTLNNDSIAISHSYYVSNYGMGDAHVLNDGCNIIFAIYGVKSGG